MKKRLLSALLVLCMVLTLMPTTALAVEPDALDIQETPEVADIPELHDNSDWISYPVIDGNIYFDPTTGAISGSDTGITSARIPSSINGVNVTSIRWGAFSGRKNLSNVVLPDSVTTIGSSAFKDCTSLKSVSIPNSITSIEFGAFSGCIELASLSIPASVIKLGGDVFKGCTQLISAGPIGGGYNYEFGWSEEIPQYAFQGCDGLTGVVIPDSIAKIEGYAFDNCINLINIHIPRSVTYIGDWAFRGCSGLTNIAILSDTITIRPRAFSGCSGITTAGPIGGGYDYEFGWTKEFPDYAFAGCSNLLNVSIPDGIVRIGEQSFFGCNKLEGIVFPSSITTIGWNAFEDCSNLNNITIPDGVTHIGRSAFKDCSGLVHVKIPGSVKFIGELMGPAFSGCSGLTTAGPIGGGYSYEFGWTKEIPDYAFASCTELTNITIPDGITLIGEGAFPSGGKLKKLSIPGSVSGFYGFIRSGGCTGLTCAGPIGGEYDYEFGWSKAIPDFAFLDCNGLESITIPSSITQIGTQAFDRCGNLKDVYYSGSETDWAKISISSGNDALTNATIHYNSGSSTDPTPPTPGETEDGKLGWDEEETRWTVAVGGKLKVTVQMGDGSTFDANKLKWYCEPSGIASYAKIVDNGLEEDGKTAYVVLCGVYPGKATLTASMSSLLSPGMIDTNPLRVSQIITVLDPKGIRFDAAERYVVGCGKSLEISAMIAGLSPQDADNVKWSVGDDRGLSIEKSSNINISSDSGLGYVYAVLHGVVAGENSVMLTLPDGRTASIPVTVTASRNMMLPNEPPKASGQTATAEGDAGNGVSWKLNIRGVLEFNGSGSIPDYGSEMETPWAQFRNDVRIVHIKSGITGIGNNAFKNFSSLWKAMLPTTLERIGENAFEGDKELQAVEFSGTYPKDWNALMKRTAGGNEPLKNLTREQITAYSNLDSITTNDAYGVAKYATTDAQTAFRAFTTLQTEMKKYTNCAKNVASEAQNKILNESEDEENERRIKAIRSGELKSALDTYESVYLCGLRKETRTAIMNAICLGFADKVDDLVEHKFKLGKIDLDAGKINGTKLDMTTDVITVQIIYKVGHYLDDLLKQREVFKTTATVKDGTYNIHVFKSGALGSSIQITSNDSLVPIGGGTPQPFSLDKISGEAMMKQYLEELCGVSKELLKEGIAAYAKYLDDLTGIGSNLKGQAEEDIKNTLDAFLRIFGLNDKTNIAVNASKIYKINEEINIIKKKGDSLKFSDLKNAADNMKQISGLSLEEIRDEATKKIIQSINKALENYWDSAIFEPEKSHAETVEEIQKALVEDIKNQNRTKSGEYDWVIDHIGLRCPVDFRVYNGENECIGYVENGEVWYTSPIFILTEGDCKDVYLPGGMDVRFEFTGTGQGEMTYVMEEVCNGETVGRRNYYGIPLTEGVSYTQNFQTGNNLQNLQANVLLATDGSTIGGSEYLDAWDETQNSAIYIDCVAENGGVVIGAGNFVKGDTVTLDAIPDEGQEFVGWYVDERLVSAEKTYQFAALDCMEIHAKFRIPYEENDKYNVSMGSKYRYNTVVSVYQDSSALSHIELYQMSGQAGTLYRTIKAMLYDTNQTLYSERILTVEYDLKNSYWLQALDLKDCSKLELYDEYGNVIAVLRSDDENKDATYTITFDANGGTVTPVTATISTDGKLSALPIPTRTGYTFDGWYTAPKGGTKVDVNKVYTEDTTLYAHWMYMGSGSSGGNSGSSSGNSSNRPSGGSSFSGITITGPNHGFVTASPKNAGKGAKVTLTVWPDSGYILDSLTVKDSRGAEVELVKLSDTRYTFIMPGGQVTVNATFVRDSSESNTSTPVSGFYDVPDNHWASKEIAWASANGIMNGTGGGAFSPDSPVNRQQTWMVLGRSAGADPSNMAAAREWAIFNNISDGSNPINPVSRQQLVALLYRYTQMKEIAATGMASLEEYPDNSDVASYAKKAMAWAVGNGIVKGTSDGHLAPFNTTSRAQFAVILYRFTQQITN